MFDKEYTFYGKHAKMVKELTQNFDDGARFFTRNVDVYMFAPIIGYLYQRKSEVDNNRSNDTKIFPDVMFNEAEIMKFIFQTIQMIDNPILSSEEKLNRAFRKFNKEANSDAEFDYNQYVLGGVELLHEKLIQGKNDPESFLSGLIEFLTDFHDLYNAEFNDNIEEDLINAARS